MPAECKTFAVVTYLYTLDHTTRDVEKSEMDYGATKLVQSPNFNSLLAELLALPV